MGVLFYGAVDGGDQPGRATGKFEGTAAGEGHV